MWTAVTQWAFHQYLTNFHWGNVLPCTLGVHIDQWMCKPATLAFSFNKLFSKTQADLKKWVGLSQWAAFSEAADTYRKKYHQLKLWQLKTVSPSLSGGHTVFRGWFSNPSNEWLLCGWLLCGSKEKLLLSRVGETHFLFLTHCTRAALPELRSSSRWATAVFFSITLVWQRLFWIWSGGGKVSYQYR